MSESPKISGSVCYTKVILNVDGSEIVGRIFLDGNINYDYENSNQKYLAIVADVKNYGFNPNYIDYVGPIIRKIFDTYYEINLNNFIKGSDVTEGQITNMRRDILKSLRKIDFDADRYLENFAAQYGHDYVTFKMSGKQISEIAKKFGYPFVGDNLEENYYIFGENFLDYGPFLFPEVFVKESNIPSMFGNSTCENNGRILNMNNFIKAKADESALHRIQTICFHDTNNIKNKIYNRYYKDLPLPKNFTKEKILKVLRENECTRFMMLLDYPTYIENIADGDVFENSEKVFVDDSNLELYRTNGYSIRTCSEFRE